MTTCREYIEKMLCTAGNLTNRFINFHVAFAKKYIREAKKEIQEIQDNDEK